MIESETLTADRRSDSRRRALLFGTMQFADGTSSMTCQIRNLSDRGARLEVASAAWLDRNFDLMLGARNRRVKAEIVWRGAQSVGVRFAENEGAALNLEEEVAFLRSERERLMARIRDLTGES